MIWDEHIQNRNQCSNDQLAPFFGKHVAWSLDGKRIVASGRDDFEVLQATKTAGYKPDQVVFSYVPFPEEVFLGGATIADKDQNA